MALAERSRLGHLDRLVPASGQRIPRWLNVASVPLVVVVVALGIWVTGALITEDARTAMLLTALWFGVAGMIAAFVALRWRALAVPVLATFVTAVAAMGGYLAVTSTVDRTVDEDVVVAATVPPDPDTARGAGAAEQPGEPAGPIALASGTFRPQAHPTSGTATLVEQPDGSRVVTLTDFATDPGPDLRVYLVRGDGSGTEGGVDVGGLKGNKGDQQYDVPADAPDGAIVIWCRAFSVAFGSATLA